MEGLLYTIHTNENFNNDERINMFLLHKVKKGDGNSMKFC